MKPGEIISNDELRVEFGVGNMGGMRRSIQNNCLVICRILQKDCMTIAGRVRPCITLAWVS